MNEKKAYSSPKLVVYGRVEDITGTFCYRDKTLGYPSDTNWKFLPFTDCPYS
jgi:hypothetical protein